MNRSHLYCLFFAIAIFVTASCTNRPAADRPKSPLGENMDSSIASDSTAETSTRNLFTVSEIQAEYAVVIKQLEDSVLDSTTFKYSCHGEKNGTVTYYTDKSQLRMVVHRYNEYDHFSATDRYFVRDGALFFAYFKNISWAFVDGGAAESITQDNVTESRIYLVDEKPVRCLEKKYIIRSNSPNKASSESVPNRKVNCKSANTVLAPFQLLLKYRGKGTAGCL